MARSERYRSDEGEGTTGPHVAHPRRRPGYLLRQFRALVRSINYAPLRRLGRLIVNTGYAFSMEDCFTMAAALAYFAVLSALPIFLILVAILPSAVRLVLPEFDATATTIDFIFRTFSPEVALWVSNAVPALQSQTPLLGGAGLLLLLWAASNVFRQLDVSVNTIWDAYDNVGETTVRQAARSFLLGRLRSLLLVLMLGGLVLADHLLGLFLFLARREIVLLPGGETWAGTLFTWIAFVLSIASGIVALAVLYRYLPPIRVPWRVVLPGAILAGLLNKVVGWLVTLTLSGLLGGLYQAAGGPVALLLWAYFVGQSIYLGCQLSRQYYLMLLAEGRIAGQPLQSERVL